MKTDQIKDKQIINNDQYDQKMSNEGNHTADISHKYLHTLQSFSMMLCLDGFSLTLLLNTKRVLLTETLNLTESDEDII